MKQTQTIAKSESAFFKPQNGRIIQGKMVNKFDQESHQSCSLCLQRVPSIDMLTKLLRIGVVGLMLCAGTAWAGPASIQGIVNDAKGKPIKNADVRIESRDGKQLVGNVKTDSKGRYILQGLQPSVYRVSLIVNGAVKASITNTKTKPDQATQLNFDLQPATATQATGKKGKRLVWVPPATGSHMGGRWVEADEGGAAAAGTLNVKRANAEQLQREAQSMATHGGN
jgi:hypothetical protein